MRLKECGIRARPGTRPSRIILLTCREHREHMKVKKIAGHPSTALARVVEPGPALRRPGASAAVSGLESAFLAFLQSKTPGALVPVERRIFLTMAEASEFSGL